MRTAIVSLSKSDEHFFLTFCKKIGFKTRILNDDDKEDAILVKMMEEVIYENEEYPVDRVYKKLNAVINGKK